MPKSSRLLLFLFMMCVSLNYAQTDLFDEFEATLADSTAGDSTQTDTTKAITLPPIPDFGDQGNPEFQAFAIKHQMRSFTWQYYATIVIFITVLIIVYSGLILSFLHFRNDLKNKTSSESEFEVSQSGIKMKSSVIGLIILAISVTFFYLYLKYAFEIEIIH